MTNERRETILLGAVAYRDNDPFIFIAAKTPRAFEEAARECIQEEIKYNDETEEDLLVYGYSEESIGTVCEQIASKDTLAEFKEWLDDDSSAHAFVFI